jgi:heme-degrading monooxygenase HmoA
MRGGMGISPRRQKASAPKPECPEEVRMAVKVIIKRLVSEEKARQMIPLFRQMRQLAMNQEGYISGETLRNLNNPEEFIVISSWQSSDYWTRWLKSITTASARSKGLNDLPGRRLKFVVGLA